MLKRTALIILVLLMSTLMAQSVMARPFADIYVECGLGAMIAPNTPVVAVITNITWDLGTTAISSEMSSPENCKGGQEEVASFIMDSYDLLETDLACGDGIYLDMLVVLADEGGEDFVASLRSEFAAYVAEADYSLQTRFEKAEALYNMVYGDVDDAS